MKNHLLLSACWPVLKESCTAHGAVSPGTGSCLTDPHRMASAAKASESFAKARHGGIFIAPVSPSIASVQYACLRHDSSLISGTRETTANSCTKISPCGTPMIMFLICLRTTSRHAGGHATSGPWHGQTVYDWVTHKCQTAAHGFP